MNLGEILSVIWHRKLLVIAITAITIGAAVAALQVIDREYEATSTLALQPPELGNDLLFFQTLDAVVSIYAAGAETRATTRAARERLGGDLSSTSVRTFESSPIIEIVARGTDPEVVARSAQAVTDVLLERVDSGEIGIPSLRLEQIDRPVTPTSAVFPNTKLTLVVAGLLGLALGIAAALLLETLGRRVRSRADLAEAAGAPVFAEIPEQPAVKKVATVDALVYEPVFRSVSEALRDLRTNLVFAREDLDTIIVTSPEGRHGKTTVAVGLSATIARAGARTILVDADLRRGCVAEMLGIPRLPGLSEALAGDGLQNVVRQTTIENLDLLPSGRLVGNPGEILATRFPRLLEALRNAYDTVVIDSTPLVPVNDARLIAGLVQNVLLVVSAGRASQRSVREAVERLALISVKPTAAVLNRSRSRSARGYYGPKDRSSPREDTLSVGSEAERRPASAP